MTTTASPPPAIEDAATTHDRDRAEIARIVADVETAFNANDPELGVAHFAANASAVSARGQRVVGRDALLEAHRAGYSGPLRDQFARYELADVVFVRPDVALATKLARAVTPDGDPLGVGHAMVALYVLVREDGRWWIVARSNTLVPS